MLIIKLPKEEKDILIRRVQEYFYEERSEEIGNLAAESILDYMMKEIGPVVYNQAISDVRNALKEKLMSLEDELYAMEQPLFTRRP